MDVKLVVCHMLIQTRLLLSFYPEITAATLLTVSQTWKNGC